MSNYFEAEQELYDEVVRLTRDMIEIRSVNPPGSEGEMADFTESYLQDLGINTKSVLLEEGSKERRSVVGRIPGKNEGSIALCGHLDTVDVTEKSWSFPPFEAVLEDGRIYGRGSADMKGGVAVILATAKALMESDGLPENEVVVALTADEERGYGGAYSLVNSGILNDDVELLVVTEPTDGKAYIGEKGELWVDVNFSGKAAHGSTPDQGINAVLLAAEFSTRIVEEIRTFPNDRSLGSTSINVGQFEGGWQVNIVPEKATVKLDIRLIKEEHKELAIDAMKDVGEELVDRYGGSFDTEITTYQEPIVSDRENEKVSGFLRAASQGNEFSAGGEEAIVSYCTDASAIIPQLETPLIICGPGEIEMAHQPDEYVEVNSLTGTLRTFLDFFGFG